MIFAATIACLLLAVIAYSRDNRLYSPAVLFTIYWAILLFLAGLKLYGIYSTSILAVLLVIIGIVSFMLGSLLYNGNKEIRTFKYTLNKRLYKIGVFICLCSLYLNISFIIEFIISGFDINFIYVTIANMTGGETESELSYLYNPNLVILQQFVGYPLLYTLVPISIVEYVTTKKRSYLIVSIVLSLIRFLFDLRRTYIVILVVFIIFVLILRNREILKRKFSSRKFNLRKKILILGAIAALSIGFSFLSMTRRGENDSDYSLFSNFYYYYVGSLPYLSARLNALQDLQYTFGLTSFRGLVSPFFALFGLLGFDKPYIMEIANENINSLHNTILDISPDHPFNSYATCFFEFYLDGGMIGTIVLSLLFGIYAQSLFYKFRNNKSNRYLVKYALFLAIFIYLSVLHFNGAVVCYIWPFILERFFYNRTKIH